MSNNMDLDSMKSAWQSLSSAGLKKDIDKDAIEKMMRRKSKSELNKILLTFTLECLLGIPIIIFMMITMHREAPDMNHIWICDFFMVGMLMFLMVPLRQFLKVGKFREQSTVIYLEKLTSVFDKIIKTILNISKVFLVIAFPVGLLSAGLDICEDLKFLVIAMLVYVPFYIGIIFLSKCYYQFFYCRRINRMKEYLRELKVDVSDEDNDEAYCDTTLIDMPVRKGKRNIIVIVCSALVALIVVAGVILYLCGAEHNIAYYIGYGIGYGFKTIEGWFTS